MDSITSTSLPTSPLHPIALRLVNADPERMRGITVGPRELRLSQFADDTQLLASSFESLERAMHILETYGSATGARVNKRKSVLIRMGSLVGARVPDTLAYLKTLGEGEYATILGVPFWEGPEDDTFWERLYAKLKKKVAAWKGVQNLSIHGRTLLVNFIIYGTPRYWLSTSTPPAWFMEAIDSDVQTILWDRSPRLQAEEIGSSREGRRWITCPEYPRVGTSEDQPLLGIGLLPIHE